MQSFLTRRRSNPVRVRGQTSTLDLPAAVSCAVHLAENYGNNNFRAIPRRLHFPVPSPADGSELCVVRCGNGIAALKLEIHLVMSSR